MDHLVFLQSIFSSKSFPTEVAFVWSLSGVGHHMLPELVWSVVLHRALCAMEPLDSKMTIVNVGLQMRVAREFSTTLLTLKRFLSRVNHLMRLESRV